MRSLAAPKPNRKRTAPRESNEQLQELSSKYSLLSVVQSHDDQLGLANLPSLITRQIIKMEPNSIEKLRLISPSWNAEAEDLLSHRRLRAPIKTLLWGRDFFGCSYLRIALANKYRSFFGVEGWERSDQRIFTGPESIVDVRTEIDINSVAAKTLYDRISRFLSRCLSIWKLELHMDYLRGGELNVLKNSLKCVAIEELCFSKIPNFNDEKYTFLEILRNNKVERLVLSLFDITCIRFGKFFSEAAILVSVIEVRKDRITQKWDADRVVKAWEEASNLLRKENHLIVCFDSGTRFDGTIRITVRKRKVEVEGQL